MAPKPDPDSVDLSFLPKEQAEELRKMYKPDFLKDPMFQKMLREHNLADRLLVRRPAIHLLASPLMEVISVTLFKSLDDGTSSQVYGTIKIVDGEGSVFDIFKQTSESPVSINRGETLMLSMPKGRAIIPSNFVRMDVALEEKVMKDDGVTAGIEFVKESQRWDTKSNEEFDEIITTKVVGKCGFALVQYVTYRHAVFATVKMRLRKGEGGGGSSSNRAHVYGTIVARCGDKYSTTLFQKKVDESVVLEYGDDIELTKPVVVVPAWSSLVIDAQLWDSDLKEPIVVNSSRVYSAHYEGGNSPEIEGENGIIDVKLKWSHALTQSNEETSDAEVPLAKKQRTEEDFNFRVSDLRKALEQTRFAQMEVFSVSVHNTVDKEVDIWGSVQAYYDCSRPYLFHKEKTCPHRLSHNELLPIAFPGECSGTIVCGMDLDLKDSYDRIISWGVVGWHYEQDFNRRNICWFDKKLCSVVPGDHGSYAAVYYSVFNGGLQAAITIRIQLKDKSCSSIKYHSEISGRICCQYTSFDYSTSFDEYFRRKLFVGDPPLVFEDTDSDILLCYSCVSVPRGSALVIDVDVDVNVHHNNVRECLKRQLIFSTDDTVELQVIDQPAHQIDVSVEWKNVPI